MEAINLILDLAGERITKLQAELEDVKRTATDLVAENSTAANQINDLKKQNAALIGFIEKEVPEEKQRQIFK